MAIEFDCPYCTATIRVPDAYGGKQGRCPKCDTHLLVPMIVRPGEQTVSDIAAPRSGAVVPGLAGDPGPPKEEFSFNATSPPKTTVRRRRARRRPSRALVIGMPVLSFLVLIAIIAYSIIGGLPELTGQFVAKQLAPTSLPRVTIPWSETGLSPEDQKVLQEVLTQTPETLASQIMTCRLIGADSGIEVQLTASSENAWFAVSPASSKPLALWLKKERSTLNQRRLSTMKASLVTYCRDKLAQIAGEPIAIDVVSVRNNVGINACSGAFSSVVQADTGRLAAPCAYEDDHGMIYFCLPKGTLSFQIVGRTFPDNSKPFAGEYTVVVAPDSSSTPLTSADGTKNNEPDMPNQEEMTPDSTTEGKSLGEEMEPDPDGEMMDKSTSGSMKSGSMNFGEITNELGKMKSMKKE